MSINYFISVFKFVNINTEKVKNNVLVKNI